MKTKLTLMILLITNFISSPSSSRDLPSTQAEENLFTYGEPLELPFGQLHIRTSGRSLEDSFEANKLSEEERKLLNLLNPDSDTFIALEIANLPSCPQLTATVYVYPKLIQGDMSAKKFFEQYRDIPILSLFTAMPPKPNKVSKDNRVIVEVYPFKNSRPDPVFELVLKNPSDEMTLGQFLSEVELKNFDVLLYKLICLSEQVFSARYKPLLSIRDHITGGGLLTGEFAEQTINRLPSEVTEAYEKIVEPSRFILADLIYLRSYGHKFSKAAEQELKQIASELDS